MKKRILSAVLAVCFSLLAGTASAYSGMENRPLIATESKIITGDQNPVVTVTTSNARFAAETLPLDRYEIYNANTELTLSSVTQDSDTRLTFQFTGTAAAPGSYLSIHIPAEGFAQSDMEYPDSNLLYVYVLSLDGTLPEGAQVNTPENPETPTITTPVEPDAEIGHLESVDDIITRDFEEITISGTGECYLQSMLKEDKTYADWIDRIDIPEYASGFYHTLAENSDKTNLSDLLVKDDYYTIQPAAAVPQRQSYEVTAAQTVQFAISNAFTGADSNPLANPDYFTDDKYNTVDITEADKNINYPALKAGEVVMTPNFNGIYVTKVKKTDNPAYEANRKDACTYISAAFHAFDRDHPEVFWLSGVSKIRILTAKVNYSGKTIEESYIFFTLADKNGFSLRAPEYAANGAVAQGIQRRDKAVGTITAAVGNGNIYQQLVALNRWLTEHNEYNTSADLYQIGNQPHECLSALEGNIGTNGPVCDGYARAFKVVCDKLGIPCTLADGYAKYRSQDNGEAHMWNYVQMKDNNWYGVDVTWNDPVVPGKGGAKSGYEHERYLLVGANTNVDGVVFGASHPVTNRVADGGVAFTNGPGLNGAAYDPNASQTVLHFVDVPASAWFAGAVQYAYENKMMSGTSANTFSPNDTTTRSMIVSILYRLEGEPAAGASAFTDVPDGKWYSKAVSWAAENNIVSGYGNGRFGAEDMITREQMAVILYQYAAHKGYVLTAENNSLTAYADQTQIGGYALEAMRWAHGMGLITGTDNGLLLPKGSATRAQAASIFMRFRTSAA